MHNGIAELERTKLSARDPERKKFILDTKRENPDIKASQLAMLASCSQDYVRKVLNDKVAKRPRPVKANLREIALPALPVPEAGHGAQAEPAAQPGAASNLKWYQRAVADAELIAGLDPLLDRLRRGEQSPVLSTNLRDPSRVRDITDKELEANTFPHNLNSTVPREQACGRDWLRYHFGACKRSTQGFVIMQAHNEDDGSPSAVLFEWFPQLLEQKEYAKKLEPIFQTLQATKIKGDGKRVQAKMTALVKLSNDKVIAAKKVVDEAKSMKALPRSYPKAVKDLEDIQKEHDSLQAVTYAMCRGYTRIQQVPALPYCRVGSLLITCVAGVARTPQNAGSRFRHGQARRARNVVRCWTAVLPLRFARARQLRHYCLRRRSGHLHPLEFLSRHDCFGRVASRSRGCYRAAPLLLESLFWLLRRGVGPLGAQRVGVARSPRVRGEGGGEVRGRSRSDSEDQDGRDRLPHFARRQSLEGLLPPQAAALSRALLRVSARRAESASCCYGGKGRDHNRGSL